jgi:hypothetical protein
VAISKTVGTEKLKLLTTTFLGLIWQPEAKQMVRGVSGGDVFFPPDGAMNYKGCCLVGFM